MARTARQVFPGEAHHVVQRGNRRQKVFFKEEDKQEYLNILGLNARLFKLQIWAYCLMDNHVHLIVVPEDIDSMTQTLSLTHQLYTRMINFREGWRGYLWEGRYKSKVLDEQHLYAAIRYIERNPVRAGLVKRPEDYLWSSYRHYAFGEKDALINDDPLFSEFGLSEVERQIRYKAFVSLEGPYDNVVDQLFLPVLKPGS